jgi:hypothetical protein
MAKSVSEMTDKVKSGLPAPSDTEEMVTEATEAPRRPSLRPEMRDDPLSRAKARAAQIRENLGDGGMDDGEDRFRIDANEVPEGWSYEWKRKLVLGKPDPAYEVELARKGWEPVPLSRHPHMMPVGSAIEFVERDGMILMERPKELTDEAKDVEVRRARSQVRQKEQQLAATPDGTMTRDHPSARPNLRKGYEPLPIPE